MPGRDFLTTQFRNKEKHFFTGLRFLSITKLFRYIPTHGIHCLIFTILEVIKQQQNPLTSYLFISHIFKGFYFCNIKFFEQATQ